MQTEPARRPEDLPNLFRSAWDAADAKAFGKLFTEDATYVIVNGDLLVGREVIQNAHEEVFHKWQVGTKMHVREISVKMLSENVAVVLTIGGIGRDRIAIDKFQTFTVVKIADYWFISAYQNTEMSTRSRAQYDSTA